MNRASVRRTLRYHAGRLLFGGVSRLPREVGRPVGRLLGRCAGLLVARDRRIAESNLRHAFPDWSAPRVRGAARQVFAALGENVYDMAAVARWSPAARRRQLSVEGLETLRGALAAGRGVLLLGGHQGAWELVAVALAQEGIDIAGIARPIREARLDAWLDRHRRALGIRTIRIDGLAGARAARGQLASGGVLGLLFDHRVRRGGVMADFFGRPARFPAGPIRLALRTGAPLLPAQIVRRPDGGHRVVIHPALPAPAAGTPRREAAEQLLRDAVGALESMIRRDPLAWAWIHPRWGTPPRPAAAHAAPAAAATQAPSTLVPPAAPAPAGLNRLTGAIPALIFALLLGGLSACGERRPTTGAEIPANAPSSALAGVTLRETIDGRLKWILTADSSQTFDQPNQTLLTRPHIDFYNAAEQVYSVMTADQGLIVRSTNDMSARGHVTVTTTDGDTLTTEQLEWNNSQARVRTDLPFTLARPDGRLTGVGFESDPGLKNYTTRDVRIDARGTDGRHGS